MAKQRTNSGPPSPETREAVLNAIRVTAEPVTASQIAKLLAPPHKLVEARVIPILEEYADAATLHRFPPKTARGKPRYWDRDIRDLGSLLVTAALAKKGPQSKADLRKAAKQLSDVEFHAVFQRLIELHSLFEHPPLPKKKSTLFGSRPPAPEAYLKDVGTQLTKVVAQLEAAAVPRDELRRALVQLVEATGISFGTTTTPSTVATPPPDNREQPVHEESVDLVSLMSRIEPAADNGALVTARNLRRAANLEKSEFDRAVLDLARQGRLTLHRHDFATSLTEAERDELVTDGAGTFYVGMALRREVGGTT